MWTNHWSILQIIESRIQDDGSNEALSWWRRHHAMGFWWNSFPVLTKSNRTLEQKHDTIFYPSQRLRKTREEVLKFPLWRSFVCSSHIFSSVFVTFKGFYWRSGGCRSVGAQKTYGEDRLTQRQTGWELKSWGSDNQRRREEVNDGGGVASLTPTLPPASRPGCSWELRYLPSQ